MDDFWSSSPRLHDNPSQQSQSQSQQSQSQPQQSQSQSQSQQSQQSQLSQPQAIQYMVQDILNEAHRQNVLTYEELHARQQSEQRREEIIETALWSRWQHQVASGTVLMNNEFILRRLRLHQPINISRNQGETS